MIIFWEKCSHSEREEVASVLSQLFSLLDYIPEGKFDPGNRGLLVTMKKNAIDEGQGERLPNFLVVSHRVHYDSDHKMHFDVVHFDKTYHIYVKRHTTLCARSRSKDTRDTGPEEENNTTVFDNQITKIEDGKPVGVWPELL
eukprot:scpid90156/ scgid8574/ 